MKYKLLAADMDATALNSKKDLTPRTVHAMEKAIEQGKIVCFSTGRSLSLVQPYIDMVRGMRYAVTCAGGSVLDTYTGEHFFVKTIDPETVKHIIAAAAGYVMPVIYIDDTAYTSAWCIDSCDAFGVKEFEPIYRIAIKVVDDAFAAFMQDPHPVTKLNLLFASDGEADEVYEKIKTLPITFTNRGPRGLEINASGVSKAVGLEALCARLGIDMSETIAIGDSLNDIEMLSSAGLNIAVENAKDKVKSIANVIVPDCDHDGVAYAIEQYLLD